MAKLAPLTRLLRGYITAAIDPLDDGSVLVHVESDHEALLLATFAVPAEALAGFDLREFPDARDRHREVMRAYMQRRRANDPAYRERERAANRERMRRGQKGPKTGD
jgi:hypothetical protein